jgi:phytoene synthase
MNDPILHAAQDDIRRGSQSFALAARLLDARVRDDAILLYSWCRHCDDAVDGQTLGGMITSVADAASQLARLRASTHAALAGRPAAGPFRALAQVVDRHGIPHAQPDELLDGLAMDVAGRRYDTLGDTLEYCYHAAGVVGVMMAMVMGVRDPRALDYASDLGIAFQLTNIARDVIADARAGRCYLPADLLERHGLRPDDLTDPAAVVRAHAAAVVLLDVAEPYYASGLAGLAMLPRGSVWGIAAARRIYREIGINIRRTSPQDWSGRVRISGWRKAMLVALAAGDGRGAILASPAIRDQLWSRPNSVSDKEAV